MHNKHMDEKFEELVKRHIKPVYNYALRLSQSESDASDITQESFIKVWRNLKKFDQSKNFKTWIFTITRNTAFDFLRKRKNISFSQIDEMKGLNNREGDIGIEETIPDPEPLSDEIFEKKELKKELENAMSKIRIDFREIIFLHYSQELNFHEISEIIGKPLNTVKSHHLRALSTLRKLLIPNSPNPS